jgi:TRAP-type C4-dicarboxylate transport system substrate-binding protein
MAGIPASHLSEIERAALTPTIPTLRRIGDALNRPLVYFLQAAEDRRRSVGMVIHLTSIGGQAAVRFAELVEEKTGGELRVRIYHHSALGTACEQVQGLAEGAIDIYVDELLSFECYAKLCGPVCLPYFFQDREHFHRFLNSPVFEQQIYQPLLENNIRLLQPVANWESGPFEVLLSTVPIFAPQELAGRRFRSYESSAAIALRQAFGATPVIVEWARVLQAFERGLIDTFLTPAAYLTSLEVHRFAKYATVLAYGYTLNLTVAVNDGGYRNLPPDVQAALGDAAQEAGVLCTRLVNEQTAIALERLSSEYGLPVIHPDQQAWRDCFDAAIRQICEGGLLPRGVFDEIQCL